MRYCAMEPFLEKTSRSRCRNPARCRRFSRPACPRDFSHPGRRAQSRALLRPSASLPACLRYRPATSDNLFQGGRSSIMPPLEQVIWFTCVATKLLVAVCASFGCMRRRWPSLAVLFWFQTLRSFVLIGLTYDAQPKAYFYVYWLGSIADCLLSFWLIHDVLHSLPGVNLIPPRMRACNGHCRGFPVGGHCGAQRA